MFFSVATLSWVFKKSNPRPLRVLSGSFPASPPGQQALANAVQETRGPYKEGPESFLLPSSCPALPDGGSSCLVSETFPSSPPCEERAGLSLGPPDAPQPGHSPRLEDGATTGSRTSLFSEITVLFCSMSKVLKKCVLSDFSGFSVV